MIFEAVQRSRFIILFAALTLLSACGSPRPVPTVVAAATAVMTPTPAASWTPTLLPTATATSSATPTATPSATYTASPTPTATATATPDPYAGLTIDDLTRRSYGDGEFAVVSTLAVTEAFTRELISYTSDGLDIVAFMNIPRGEGPFPITITLHGYVEPARYRTLTYTTPYADALARAGYLVIHPNLRNFPPSDNGPDRFRTGLAADVLNLVALIKREAGKPGPLQKADGSRIGVWGHSMGGGVSTRVITISPDVRAAVLYGAMSGDERQNYEKIALWSGQGRGIWELAVPEADLLRISPVHFFDRITAAVSIHHGDADATVPLAWSQDTCQRLQDLGKTVECFTYPGQPHTFVGDGNRLFIQRMIDFFDRTLRSP